MQHIINFDALIRKIMPIAKLGEYNNCIALFDLDDTLIIGDIGEALFAYLCKEGFEMPLKWKEYWRLINTGHPGEAFIRMCSCMEGISTSYVKTAVNSIFDTDDMYITFVEDDELVNVPVPKPNPLMQTVLDLLRVYGCDIYIISSSHSIAVTLAAERFFKIAADHVFGVRNREEIVNEINYLTSDIIEPVPVREGKAMVYYSRIGSEKPFLAFGDSPNDVWMFNLVRQDGMAVYVGNKREKYEEIAKSIDNPDSFYCLI